MRSAVTIGMVGNGRATELHMEAYSYVRGITLRYKSITSGHSETAKRGQERYGYEQTVDSIDEMCADPEIDVIDICSPPHTHDDYVIKALEAGKYVICEKPLSGFFGYYWDKGPVGKTVSKVNMYDEVMKNLERVNEVVKQHPRKFMYAENFIYAPAIQKAAEIIRKKKSRILCMKGEESLKGSSSPVAGEWSKTGGGTFTRTGSHPLSAILWLKTIEADVWKKDIYVSEVIADMATITDSLNAYDHRHIAAQPQDVEDFGAAVLTFSDGTKAVVMATDTLLGGSRNYIELYCNDAVIHCKLTMSDAMSTYFLDEDRLEDVYLSEMLPAKTGWNHPFVADEIMRGYMNEMQDFMECVAFDREPISNYRLAYDTTKITYAAYMAAESGRRIQL